jgi:hypothetical protein
VHLDNWIFVLLVVVVSLLRWLLSKATRWPSETDQKPTKPGPQQPQPRRTPPLSEEEQIRKFLEALGQPSTAKPPPPVAPRTDIPPRPVAPVQPPYSPIAIPEMPRPRKIERRVKIPAPAPTVRQQLPRTERRVVVTEQGYQTLPVEAPTFELAEASTSPPQVARAIPAPTAGQMASADQQQSLTIADLLRSAGTVRQAVILREILGQPRGLQPLEDLPGTA